MLHEYLNNSSHAWHLLLRYSCMVKYTTTVRRMAQYLIWARSPDMVENYYGDVATSLIAYIFICIPCILRIMTTCRHESPGQDSGICITYRRRWGTYFLDIHIPGMKQQHAELILRAYASPWCVCTSQPPVQNHRQKPVTRTPLYGEMI